MKKVDTINMEYTTREQKQSALRYLIFLTKKRSGCIKAIGFADGRKQQ